MNPKDHNKKHPPSLGLWLLKLFLPAHERLYFLREIEAAYLLKIENKGGSYAYFWYWKQIFTTIPFLFMDNLRWSFVMLTNYLKIALRNIKRHKAYSLINISGLAIGMASCIFISLWVMDEMNFNNFHKNHDSVYQVIGNRSSDGGESFQNDTPVPLGPELSENYPEVIYSSRYKQSSRILLNFKDKSFYEGNAYFVDPAFLEMFTFNMLIGDEKTALDAPHTMVISENFALKYFAGEDPIGKTLIFNAEFNLTVAGVFENSPYNSSLNFDVLLPWKFKEELDIQEGYEASWGHNSTSTFIQLGQNNTVELFDAKIVRLLKDKLLKDYPKEQANIEKYVIELSSLPLKDLRFAPSYGGSRRVMYMSIFSAVAFLILLTACINFTNLSTARASKRSKEIGLRKVAGAQKKSLIWQFLGESMLMTFIALLFSIVLFVTLLPVFNNMIGREIPVSILTNSYVIPVLILISLFTGLTGGAYPALMLSSLQPAAVFKGGSYSGGKSAFMRKSLVVFQLTASISLLIGIGIIYKQINYVKNVSLGYDKEHVVCINLNTGSMKYTDILKSNLQKDSRIMSISGAYENPSFVTGSSFADWEGKNPAIKAQSGNFRVDFDYVKTMKIELLAGRDFSKEFPGDVDKNVIINEKMAKLMEFRNEDAIGKRITFGGDEGTIVGVVSDFHYQPLSQNIGPAVLNLKPKLVRSLIVRVAPGDISQSLGFIKSTWENILPSDPFEYTFLDANYEALYRSEESIASMLINFAFLTVFIACLGIFGLASYIAEQRTKEIGIRKVFGASFSEIIGLLSTEFVVLCSISALAAWPLSYYLMNNWLQNYAYQTKMSFWAFVIPTIIVMGIIFISISFQVVKSATANPIDSIRYE